MKQDEPPPEAESRILQALAAAPLVPAAPPASVAGGWGALTSTLKAPLTKIALVGVLSGGAIWTGQTLSRPTAPQVSPAEMVSAAPSAGRLAVPLIPTTAPTAPATPALASAVAYPSPQTTAALSPPTPDPAVGAPARPRTALVAPDPAPKPGQTRESSDSHSVAPPVLSATATPALSAAPAPPPGTPADALLREVEQVHAIAALVNAERCPEARAAIARYRAGQPAGQLAAEVTILENRCRSR
jgi:hypothetical protein